jgi:putative ABC transport system permease protein
VGLVLGVAILRGAPALIPEGLLPAAVALTFDLRVVGFCAAAALLVGVLFGIAPAWQATGFAPAQALASGSRTTSARGGRLRNMLVAAEVATAVLLLFGAGLLLRTLLAVTSVDRGYRAENALTMMLDPLGSSYPTAPLLLQFYDAVEREVAAVPGVKAVAYATTLPLGESDAGQFFFTVAGAPPVAESQMPTADYQIVSHGYFRALDLPIMAGRSFDERDKNGGAPVCIVNEAFVRKHLNGRSPIGERVALRESAAPESPQVVREIVGVARQVKGRPDESAELIQIYVPVTQEPIDDIYLVVRPAAGRAEALAPAVRAAIGRIDKQQLVSVRDVKTLENVAQEATSRYRFRAQLVMAFAVLALLLAMVGLFGVLGHSVQQRMRDFGVRRALGATTGDVLRLVVKSAAGVIGIGAAIGLGLAIALGRLIATMLFGVEPMDPVTFAFVTLVLAVTAAIATAGPAWRATRVDPIRALRQD